MNNSNLPDGWTKEFSRSQNRDYFYHHATKTSLWSLEEVMKKTSEQKTQQQHASEKHESETTSATKRQRVTGNRVAIVVPFRDLDPRKERQRQLEQFAPYMASYLESITDIDDYKLFIIEQSDDKRKFNRGKLLNIGFLLGKAEGFNTFIFHDVDLLPQEPLKQFYTKKPARGEAVHIARCWSRYNQNDKYLGGIVSFSDTEFEGIDGFPNVYWGWGGEDDELSKRVRDARLNVTGPDRKLNGAIVDLEEMSLEQKLAWLRSNRQVKCDIKWECNDAHDEVRSQSKKPQWWGLQGMNEKINVVGRNDDRFERCSIITVDVGLNYQADGTGHWTNAGKKS